MKTYDRVIWDWNGTLLDDVHLAVTTVNELLCEHALPPLSEDRYREIFDFPVRDYYERAGFDLGRYDFNDLSRRFCARFEERLEVASIFAAATRALERLRGAGTRQYLLSNTEHESLRRMLNRYDLGGAFDDVQGMGDTLAAGKTSGGRELLRRCALETGRTVLIGDTAHDAEVAEALGIDCILVASGHHSRPRLLALGHPVLASLDELP